jgi:hypothetical protein
VFVADPDGFYVELLQLDPAPATSAPASSMVMGARWGTVVEDAEKSANFYRDHFGREPKVVYRIRKNSMAEDLYLDRQGRWTTWQKAAKFSTVEALERFAKK